MIHLDLKQFTGEHNKLRSSATKHVILVNMFSIHILTLFTEAGAKVERANWTSGTFKIIRAIDRVGTIHADQIVNEYR